ncbi:MAG: AEC family transporter [Clostridia bacterium]|nr:AEC family transporter [Clostridia bacterium]
MEKLFAVLEIIVPIFATVGLGIAAKRKTLLTTEQVRGLTNFVTKFCLPCVLFNSCLSATLEAQSLVAMLCSFVTVLVASLLAFRLRKGAFPYHNLPMLFCAQESGMLGIPLYMTLFGASVAYRIGVLDVAQSFVAISVMALLAAPAGSSASPKEIVKSVFRSPLLLASLCGLALNFTGAIGALERIGVAKLLTATTGFIAQPISAVMLFCVGYNFSLARGNRQAILRLSALHFGLFAAAGAVALLLLKGTGSADRFGIWAVILHFTLPASYLAPGFARNEEEATVAASVCSLLTVVSLAVFCIAAIVNA